MRSMGDPDYVYQPWSEERKQKARDLAKSRMIKCDRCGERIGWGHQSALSSGNFHMECAQRMVIGGANHLLKQCTCCGGTLPPDPERLSKRDAARVAVAIWEVLNR